MLITHLELVFTCICNVKVNSIFGNQFVNQSCFNFISLNRMYISKCPGILLSLKQLELRRGRVCQLVVATEKQKRI